ncbi:MAG: tetratricopeptide repeat protein, partial [Pseudomonadota bacterium]
MTQTNSGLAPEQLFANALTAHQQGDIQQAEYLYREVLRGQPAHAGALNMLGLIGIQSGNLGAGAMLIERALAIEPENADFLNNFAMACLQQQRVELALEHFVKAVKQRPRFAEAHFNLANCYLGLARHSDAEKHYRKALKIRPDYVDALNNLGNLLRQMGKPHDASKLLFRLSRLAPDFAQGSLNYALALQACGRINEALTVFERARTLAADDSDVLLAYGRCLRLSGDLPAAIAQFEALGDTDPNHVAAWDELGITHYALNHVEAARGCFERGVALAPKSSRLLDNLGMCLQAQGEDRQANQLFLDAISLDAGFGPSYKSLAYANAQGEGAQEWIEKINAALSSPRMAPQYEADMYFALGKFNDELSRFDEAFAAYRKANDLRRNGAAFDGDAQSRFIDAVIANGSRERLVELGHDDLAQKSRSLFIIGMP